MSEAVKVLKGEYVLAAIKKFNMDRCLIFCRTKIDCDNLEQYINAMARNFQQPISVVCLHGDRAPEERKGNLQAFKAGKANFLICTDVAARGLDIVRSFLIVSGSSSSRVSKIVFSSGAVCQCHWLETCATVKRFGVIPKWRTFSVFQTGACVA